MSKGDMTVLVVMAIYVIVILVIGFAFAKRSNESSESYFIGGRKLGPWVTAMSAEASDMSGWLLMGLPGVAYFAGASEAMWTAIGLAIGTYLNWLFVAKRIRKYSEKAGNAITLPEFFSNRFGDKKHILMTVSALIILIFLSVYVGSCFATCGKLFSSTFGLPYGTMMIVGALLVFIYTFAGGYLSVCTTDLIQGILMFLAIIIIFIGTIGNIGGVENAVAFLKDIPGFLSATHTATPVLGADGMTQVVEAGKPVFGEAGDYGILTIVSTLAWGLGYFGMPQVLVRFFGIEDPKNIRKSRIIAIVWCVISLALAILIGLFGRAMIPTELLTAGDAEKIFIAISKMILPAFMTGIVVAGIFAATMSSSDSYMLIVGSAIAENIYRGLLKRNATDKQVMFVSRCTLVAVLIFGIVVAQDPNSSIFRIVSYAWAGFGAAFGPVVLLSLYWRRGNKNGALAGMIVGAATVIIWNMLETAFGGIFTIYELLPGFIFALVINVIVSLATKPPSKEVVELFDNYMDDSYMPDPAMFGDAAHSKQFVAATASGAAVVAAQAATAAARDLEEVVGAEGTDD
ncbi:MAG: sodium/proline symporter PutP [Coriobacteriales bacterium]|jgi:sodium/proline symporter